MGNGGRPLKLTDEIQEDICKVIRSGNYIETACNYVGINKTTVYDWMKRGAREKERVDKNPRARTRKSEEKFVEFSNAISKALSYAEVRDVTIIGKAAEQQWQAAAWRLERKFPDRWGRKDKQQVEHSGKDGGPIKTDNRQNIDLSELSDKELDMLEKIMERQGDNDSGDQEGESD